MSLVDLALAMVAGTLAIFLVFQAVALVLTLRRRKTTPQISALARMVWTTVPLAVVALLLASLYMDGRLRL